MRSFFLPNWSPPDDPARPLPAEGRPWPSDDDDDDDELDYDDDIPEDNDKNNEESKPDARNDRSDNPNKTRSRWMRWNQVAINLCCGKMTTMIMMFTKMAL